MPFLKGHKINIGKKPSQETREKISKGNLGKKNPMARNNPQIFKKGHIPWHKGKKGVYKKDVLEAMSKGHRGKSTWWKGSKGEKSPVWKGGSWGYCRRTVKIRDDYICQICGLRDPEIMEVDHIKPKSEYPELEFVLENLVTLCPNCHRRKTNREIKGRQWKS